MRCLRSVLAAAALAAALVPSPSRAAGSDVMLVLDVSNSMWGQIDGTSKIEIAREVIGDLLQDWDPAVNLGMVAYGHRREADCTDIQTVVPVGPLDVDAFVAQVNGLVPRGRTPLTEAVRTAAEALAYHDRPATVVLVSDGIETCNADPCALAAELERTGVDFTAHVIGFDVADPEEQAQLACIAENTGGVFVAASNAQELADAFINVTESLPPPPEDTLIALEAVAADSGLIIEDGVSWTVVSLSDESTVLSDSVQGRPELFLDDGDYVAIARTDAAQGQVQFSVVFGEDAIHRVRLQPLLPDATVAVERALITAGAPFEVTWTGPDGDRDYITIVPVGADEGTYDNYTYTRDGSPLSLLAPDVPGAYEVRYMHADSDRTLASVAVTVVEVPATLEAVDAAVAGSDVQVTWTGPDNHQDYITIVPAGSPEGTYDNYTRTRDGSPLSVRAPDAAGSYEIRYVSQQSGRTLASRPITLTETSATLEAADSAVAGSEVEVTWTGPDNHQDYITIVPAGSPEGTYDNYTRTRDGSPLSVRAPDAAGSYEIRYVSQQSGRTLASRPITLTETTATLEAADSAVAGSEVEVTWTGPDNHQDYITIVPAGSPEGTYDNYTRTRDGSPLSVRAPDAAGSYEIRYVSQQSGRTLASRPITLTETSATLEAADSAVAGSEVEVTWTGPDNHQDYITIVPAGSPEGTYDNYTRTRDGSPLSVRAPDNAGAYEIRYVSQQSGRTLASRPITLTETSATLEAVDSVVAGAEVDVTWTGPDNHQDYITIVPAGSAEGSYDNYTRTRDGSPLTVLAPDMPGAYEIRYVSQQSGRTVASRPITLTEATATLDAAASVVAGADVEIAWTGPDNRQDYLTIVPAGAPEGSYDNYVRTRDGSRLSLRAPLVPGSYEIRYVSNQSGRTLASRPVTVTEATAALVAPSSATPGLVIAVEWTGPGYDGDRIAIAEAGAPDRDYEALQLVSAGNPLELRAPDRPGTYEIRYLLRSELVIARIELKVQ